MNECSSRTSSSPSLPIALRNVPGCSDTNLLIDRDNQDHRHHHRNLSDIDDDDDGSRSADDSPDHHHDSSVVGGNESDQAGSSSYRAALPCLLPRERRSDAEDTNESLMGLVLPFDSSECNNEANASSDPESLPNQLKRRNNALSEKDDSSFSDDSLPGMVNRIDISDIDSDSESMPDLLVRRTRSYSSSEEDHVSCSESSLPAVVDSVSISDIDSNSDSNCEGRWKLSIASFPQFQELSDDCQIDILSYIADVPYETIDLWRYSSTAKQEKAPHKQQSTLTCVIPLVSKHFYQLCESSVNYYWRLGLERLLVEEPSLWKEGLLRLLHISEHERNNVDESYINKSESPVQLLKRIFEELPQITDHKQLFQSILESCLRYTGPVFYMPANISLAEPFGMYFFEPRYRILIQRIMEDYPEGAKQGNKILPNAQGKLPHFVYAHSAPLARGTLACVVQIQTCLVHPDGSADVSLIPTAHVRLESVKEMPNTAGLREVQCIRMTKKESACEEFRSQARRQPATEIDLLELLAGEGGLGINNGGGGAIDIPNLGIQATIREILAYLATRAERDGGGNDDNSDNNNDDEHDERMDPLNVDGLPGFDEIINQDTRVMANATGFFGNVQHHFDRGDDDNDNSNEGPNPDENEVSTESIIPPLGHMVFGDWVQHDSDDDDEGPPAI